MNAHTSLGERLQSVRKRRGLSQRELAELSGVSVSLIRQFEQEVREDTRVETARKLAIALRVPTTALLSRPEAEEADPDVADAWEPVRRALAGQMPQPDESATPEGVRGALRELAPALTSHRYTAVLDALPVLLRDADSLNGEPAARQVHADILNTTGYLLTQTRQFGVAELTLGRAIDAAGDRLDAAAAADTLVWLYLRQGRLAKARQTATRWADETEPRFSRATVIELVLWGRFLLNVVNAATRDNRPGEAEDALQLATAAAARMGREVRRHENSQCVFGPYTVACIRVETRVLTEQPDKALAIADSLPPRLPYPELVSRLRHKLDIANAMTLLGRYPEAVAAMREVRDRAPEWLVQQRYARDILSRVIDRRRTLTAEMRELADFVRLP